MTVGVCRNKGHMKGWRCSGLLKGRLGQSLALSSLGSRVATASGVKVPTLAGRILVLVFRNKLFLRKTKEERTKFFSLFDAGSMGRVEKF